MRALSSAIPAGGGCAGALRPRGGERERPGRDQDTEGEGNRDGGERASKYAGGNEYPHRHIERAHGEPRDVYGRWHSRGGGAGRLHDGTIEHRAERGGVGPAAGAPAPGRQRQIRKAERRGRGGVSEVAGCVKKKNEVHER